MYYIPFMELGCFKGLFKNKNENKKINISDIEIRMNKNIPSEILMSLYFEVGWCYHDSNKIKNALESSIYVLSAWKDENLIGIIRATGDCIFHATIWDFAVHPYYQNNGVGTLLLKTMLEKLQNHDIKLIILFSEYAKKHFYSKLGFETSSHKIITMCKYKK